jgi:hypothetical protein
MESRPVGSWYLELPGDLGPQADVIAPLAAAVEHSSQLLFKAGMLVGEAMVLRKWIEREGEGFRSAGLLEVTLPMPGGVAHHSTVSGHIHRIAVTSGKPNAIPEVAVTGNTALFDRSGALQHHPGALDLDVMFDGVGISVLLTTYSDAWMARSITGKDQSAIAARNAPRLHQVLQALSRAFETEVVPVEATRYAVPTEEGLENRPDVFGSTESS